jgi:hypothetical protein
MATRRAARAPAWLTAAPAAADASSAEWPRSSGDGGGGGALRARGGSGTHAAAVARADDWLASAAATPRSRADAVGAVGAAADAAATRAHHASGGVVYLPPHALPSPSAPPVALLLASARAGARGGVACAALRSAAWAHRTNPTLKRRTHC